MVKRYTTFQKNQNEFCGNCGNGIWYYDSHNLDNYDRKPICCHCRYQTRSMLRSEKGCEHWTPKKDGELINIK